MSTHTPGPWTVNAEQVFGNGYKIASVNDAGHSWQQDRDLIAAAPDTYAALVKCVAALTAFAREDAQPEIAEGLAAIAKAEGTQS